MGAISRVWWCPVVFGGVQWSPSLPSIPHTLSSCLSVFSIFKKKNLLLSFVLSRCRARLSLRPSVMIVPSSRQNATGRRFFLPPSRRATKIAREKTPIPRVLYLPPLPPLSLSVHLRGAREEERANGWRGAVSAVSVGSCFFLSSFFMFFFHLFFFNSFFTHAIGRYL